MASSDDEYADEAFEEDDEEAQSSPLVALNAFAARKLHHLRPPRSTGSSLRVPRDYLNRLRALKEDADVVPCRLIKPRALIDKVKIQALLAKMKNEIDQEKPLKPRKRTLFTYVAYHKGRLEDQVWASCIPALESRVCDPIVMAATAMNQMREAYL